MGERIRFLGNIDLGRVLNPVVLKTTSNNKQKTYDEKRYTYNEIVDRFGKDVADKAISTGAEPTSCVVDPLHEGLSLWAEAPIEIDGYIIRAYYYLTEEDEQNLDFFDWEEKAEFEVEEIF